MKPSLQVSQFLIDKLSIINEAKFAKLYGVFFNNTTVLLAIQADTNLENELEYCLPTEFDLYGLISVNNDVSNETEIVRKLQQEIDVTDNPIFLTCNIKESQEITSYILINGQLQKTRYTVISEQEIYKNLLYVRLRGYFTITCDADRSSYDESILELRNQVTSGRLAFNIPKTTIYLLGNESECYGNPISYNGDLMVGDVCKYSDVTDGKKSKDSVGPHIIDISILKKVSKDNLIAEKDQYAPVCFLTKKQRKTAFIPVKIDVLSLISKQMTLSRLYAVLVESILKNLKAYHLTLLKNSTDDSLILPEVHHFYPSNCGHFVTIWMPKGIDQAKFGSSRKALHEQFLLPTKRPLFKRENQYSFSSAVSENGQLTNPHEKLKNPKNEGKIALVKGKYSYYHYNQNNINDSGWGCAYRSLQTLASWFKWQGYVDRDVPTIDDIQRCLVDIGDKPANFIGSKQWIGSMEVSFVLNSLLGVTCRIINVSNGPELAYEGAQLVRHFEEYGTPIMIGGGNLAHTILGVDYNEETGNIKFLILDPHYEGPEDLHVIQNKGWCGWKGLEFWSKTSYYNMCLPLVPSGV